MQDLGPTRCLILACGNPLRGDDGVGPWLIARAQEQFSEEPNIRVMYRQQWTPELSEDLARADAVIFIDASVQADPGAVQLQRITAGEQSDALPSHHLNASQLLALCRDLFDAQPRTALLLTVGIGSVDFGMNFSESTTAALPQAEQLLAETVQRLLKDPAAG